MEQVAQSKHSSAISAEAYQLAEEYQIGQPLAVYNMRVKALRLYNWYGRILLIGAVMLLSVGLITLLVTLRHISLVNGQYPAGSYGSAERDVQILHVQDQLIEDLLPLMLGLIEGVGAIVVMRLATREHPAYVLICTEGLLLVRPKKVDVTRWEEVTDLSRLPGSRQSMYRLNRRNRKRLAFGEALEDVDELAEVIKQHITSSPQ